jgi:hypothetical protein
MSLWGRRAKWRMVKEPLEEARTESPEELFSPETLARLTALRERFDGHPEWMESTMDERRLVFARWLVESGYMNEDLADDGGAAPHL